MFNINLLFFIFCADKHVINCLLDNMLTHHCQRPHSDLRFVMLEFITVSWFCCINVVLYHPHNQQSQRHVGQVILQARSYNY